MFNPYAVMYDAKMTVKRWRDVEVDGYTKQQVVEVARDRPCRYSSSGQVSVGTPNPSIQNSHRLFCGLEEDVREGDLIEITLRTGKLVEVTLGECHPYSFQWQCEVKRDDNAGASVITAGTRRPWISSGRSGYGGGHRRN